jgi:hypothetical protein
MLIAPTPQLEYTTLGDCHFVLAQRVLKDENYEKFYASSHKFKLMDNGIYENIRLRDDEIIDAGKQARIDELVAPDIPGDPKTTFKMTKDFLSIVPKEWQVMAVPHGKSVQEYCDSFMKLSALDEVHSLGISILDLWKFTGSYRLRPMVIHYLYQQLDIVKDIHLLGLDEPLELFCYRHLAIRSVDTSLPFSLAQIRFPLYLVPDSHARTSEDATIETKYHHLLLERNIQYLKKICRGV